MTVKELIEALSKMPQDDAVYYDGEEITGCYVNTEHFKGDSANPNCPVIEAVELR